MKDKLTNIQDSTQLHIDLEQYKHAKLFVIDLANFKEINIKYTDVIGDAILKKFARDLEDFATIHEMHCYRIGADEFALLKDTPFDLSAMEKLVFALCNFIQEQEYKDDSISINIDAHIGISLDHFHPLEKAQSALELAKKQNQPFVTYSEFASNLLNESKEEIYKSIKNAIHEKKLLPFYQSVIDKNHTTLYNEILVRLEGPDGIQTPKFFLSLSREKGVYETIVKEIVSLVKNIKETKALNLSCHDFENEELFTFLIETFKDTNTIFELQNDTYLHNTQYQENFLTIKQNNIKICIDNVLHVKDLEIFEKYQIDFVKVHGDIIRLLPLYDKEYLTCKDILVRIQELGAKAIATHINSDESYKVAQELGFDYFQGFLFGKPSMKI
jgi:diguanylate cyclase (GGDEF)-like protein